MKISIFMIFQFFSIISAWAVKALEDGKVTAAEGLELVVSLAGVLGVQPEFNVSDYIISDTALVDSEGDEIVDEPDVNHSTQVKRTFDGNV